MAGELAGVVVMRVDADPPCQQRAALAGGQRDLMAFRVEGGGAWKRGENLIVVAGEPGQRRFVQGVYVARNGNVHLVRKTSAWRRFDARQEERHTAGFEARLRTDGGWRAAGMVRDVSVGGIAVEVPTVPPSTRLRVEFALPGLGAELPVSLVSMSDTGAGTRLHCRFENLNEAQAACVLAVLASLEGEQQQQRAS